MRFEPLFILTVCSAASLLACGDDDSDPVYLGPAGSAGAGTGGSGASASGGSGATGGASGGSAGSAASSGSGGTAAEGGAPPLDECDASRPEWVFCSGFEEGNKDIWDDYDGNPDDTNILLEDPGPRSLDGNHVMQFSMAPGRGTVDLVKELPDSYDRLYARWYIRYDSGFDFSAPSHGSGFHAGDRDLMGRSGIQPDGTDRFNASIEHTRSDPVFHIYSYYPGMYQDCVDPNGSCWGDHFPCMADDGSNYCTNPDHRETVMPPALTDDRWYCVELLLDGGTPTSNETNADGTLSFWVDGQEIGPWTNLWYRSTADLKLTILWLKLFHHEDHSVAGVTYDNVVVSTDRIGCF